MDEILQTIQAGLPAGVTLVKAILEIKNQEGSVTRHELHADINQRQLDAEERWKQALGSQE